MVFRAVILSALAVLTFIAALAVEATNLERGITLYEEGELDAAGRIFRQELAARPDHAEAAYYLGRVLHAENNYADAVQWLRQAAAADTGNARYHSALGEALGNLTGEVSMLRKMSLSNESKKALLKAVALDGDLLEARDNLMQFYLQAPGIAGGSETKALEQAEEIKKRDPAAGHRAFAAIYEHQDKNNLALAEFKQLVASGAASRDDRRQLGLYYVRERDYAKGFALFEELVASDPEDMMAHYMIGRTAAHCGENLARGAETMKIYLASTPAADQPTLAWASYRLGQIYQHQGDSTAARAAYRRTLELQADHKEAKKALKELR